MGTMIAILVSATALAISMQGATLQERLHSADAVALGRLFNVTPTSHAAVSSAMLRASTWLKGRRPPNTSVRVYTVGAENGVASLWLFQRGSDGVLEESKPILRMSPDIWPYLPADWRAKVYSATYHAESSVVNGLRLHMFRVPGANTDPLAVWCVLENVTDKQIELPNAASALTFTLVDGGGTTTVVKPPIRNPRPVPAERVTNPATGEVTSPITVPHPAGNIRPHSSILVSTTGTESSSQLQLSPRLGAYAITAVLQRGMTSAGWHGKLTARIGR